MGKKRELLIEALGVLDVLADALDSGPTRDQEGFITELRNYLYPPLQKPVAVQFVFGPRGVVGALGTPETPIEPRAIQGPCIQCGRVDAPHGCEIFGCMRSGGGLDPAKDTVPGVSFL